MKRALLIAAACALASSAGAEPAFENAASAAAPASWTAHAMITLGEEVPEANPSQGTTLGLNVGADVAVASRLRLGGWVGANAGGSICVDGSSTSPPDPFLGCYSMNTAAIGLRARVGLLGAGPVQLGLEAGASIHTVPASELLFGEVEQALLALSAHTGKALVFARAGGGLAQLPSPRAGESFVQMNLGAELAPGSVHPVVQGSLSQVFFGGGVDPATQIQVSLGVVIELG